MKNTTPIIEDIGLRGHERKLEILAAIDRFLEKQLHRVLRLRNCELEGDNIELPQIKREKRQALYPLFMLRRLDCFVFLFPGLLKDLVKGSSWLFILS